MSLPSSIPHQDSRETEIDPRRVVPFGLYGAGLFTGHPVGLVVVFGLLFMGFVGLSGAHWFYGALFCWVACGASFCGCVTGRG